MKPRQVNLNSLLLMLITSLFGWAAHEIYVEQRSIHDIVLHISDKQDEQQKQLKDQAADILAIKTHIGWGSPRAPMAP